ncbi:MAG: YiiX/YebB-like N1pC/P60 family cysteine hydrolase, partial [Pseudobdellovibrionaceae bacterium]
VWEARKGAQGGYQVNERLINSIRKIFRVFRTAEDMIGETGIQHGKLQNNQQAETAFQASNQGNLVIYPKYRPKYRTEPLEIKDGDVIVMRGNKHNSAAIARITTEDSQFSHALIVHIANDGKKYAVEALIEEGIVIHDLDKILNEGVGRMILLRQADQHLARQAALVAYNRGREAEAKGGEPYDFSMSIFKTNSNGRVEVNYDSFFCSKVISFAYDIASNGHFVPGRYLSKLPQDKNGPFLAGIGVTAAETIAPGDLEVDTRFDIVADWRDFRITQGLRLREVVLDKLFDMMENQGYQFQANAEINIISRTAKNLSRVPLFAGLITMLVGKIPSYMNQDVIATMMMLQFTADPMYQDLIQVDNEYSRTTGLTMSPLALSAILERNIQAGQYSLTYLVR